MTKNPQLHSALRQLNADIKNLGIDEAIEKIDEAIALAQNADHEPHFLVQKGNALWFANRRSEAVDTLTDCCNRFDSEPSGSFFLGQYLVELAQFRQAKNYLTRCIEASKQIDDEWYLDSAHLLHAYAAAKIGDKQSASQSLSLIADDEAMDWIDIVPPVSTRSVKEMLR
jgi:tetratricopeptide (TPR) repeat protein